MEAYLMQFLDLILHLDKYLPAIMSAYGHFIYAILFFVVFCETGLVVTPFLPGDSLLFACGALAAAAPEGIDIAIVIPVFLAAAILGDACNYFIGEKFGTALLNVEHSLIKKEHIKKASDFYAKHSNKTIFLCRFVPIMRTFAPFVAGIGKMKYLTFAKYNVLGGLTWVILFVGAGYFFGNIPAIKNNFTTVVMGIVFVSILPMVIEIIRGRK
ncbi:MAG: DedA family protein [Phascolarctobacterium sp.]|nr:DedA family protein [Phascolarctobacterium sp.]